ncbi:AI-2E family transporter [Arthrobacter alpinus]|uniref:AI-2E family transporter n=1 Tax=Arthrobacter alpinus TaxID=656366 RepID=UPI0021BD9E7D|nr:AI-2E family transporter [Arthrobacter alpinus]
MAQTESNSPAEPLPPAKPPSGRFTQGLPTIWADAMGRSSIRSAQVLLVLTLVAAVIWALTQVPVVVTPILIALILASAISPLVHWLTGRRWPRAAAVLTSFVAILAVFGGVITGIVFLIRSQLKDLSAQADIGIDRLHGFIVQGPYPITDTQINGIRNSIQNFILSTTFGNEALTGLRVAAEIAVGVILMAVILFFFLKDGERIRNFLIGFLPAGQRRKAHEAVDHGAIVLGGYVRGTALVALTDALIIGLALTIMRVPLALPLAVFVFIGGFIPIIGATAAGTLAVVVALIFNGPVPALVVLIVLVAANQLEHHLLQPLLMGKVLRIHGLAILLALAAGTALAGLIGALLAVPLTAVGWTVIKVWTGRDALHTSPSDAPEVTGSPDPNDDGRA